MIRHTVDTYHDLIGTMGILKPGHTVTITPAYHVPRPLAVELAALHRCWPMTDGSSMTFEKLPD